MARGAPRVIDGVKFHRALKPGECFELRWKSAANGSSFRCERDAALVAEGTLDFGAPHESTPSNGRSTTSAATPSRCARCASRRCKLGRRVIRPLLYPLSLYFVLTSRTTRRVSREYLARVLPHPPRFRDVLRHVFSFASISLDRVFLLTGYASIQGAGSLRARHARDGAARAARCCSSRISAASR